jgi:hypothetical protein
VATADTGRLIGAALRALAAIYRPGFRYKKAGVVFLELIPAGQAQAGLFDAPDNAASKARMRADDALNRRYGRHTVTFAASGRRRGWKLRSALPLAALYDELGGAAAGLTVCNDFGNNVPYGAYLEAFSQIRAPVVFPIAAPNLEPRDDIWPAETAPVFRRREEGVELVQLRWGIPPARPKGAPIINFRSEGRHIPKGRCLIPVSHFFFEFTRPIGRTATSATDQTAGTAGSVAHPREARHRDMMRAESYFAVAARSNREPATISPH